MIARPARTIRILACLLIVWPILASSAEELPENIPVPPDRPTAEKNSNADTLPSVAPLPEPAPARPEPETAPGKPPEEKPASPAEVSTPASMPAAEVACRAELGKLGVAFRDVPSPEAKGGCALPFPVEVSGLMDGVKIQGPITVNCATALATAKFVHDVITPAAKEAFKAQLKSFTQASGYVCRPRNGTTKLSEHAFGNAIDIASFTLADDKVIAVEPAPPREHEAFLRKVRNAACGPFKTVLGPGSDADHALHFHFDLAQRRNGGTYCK